MTASFNLVDRPWIPCQFAGTAVPHDLSLRDALARAKEITGIVADSPLETIAVHRLLLAVLHRIFRVVDDADWSQLWEADCFDAERPFYQAPGLPEAAGTTVAKLGHEFSAGNKRRPLRPFMGHIAAVDPGG